MSLSMVILAHNSAAYVEKLLRVGRELADEIVVGIDQSSADTTVEICREYAHKMFFLEAISPVGPALCWLSEQCTGDWILRVDHSELPSARLAQILPELMRDREVTHYWIPRRWVVGHDRARWIVDDPWWPDWQPRLFRNIRSLLSLPNHLHRVPGHFHRDYVIRGAGARCCEGAIYVYDLVYHDEQRRRYEMERYRQFAPGSCLAHLYFPDQTVVTTVRMPPMDAPLDHSKSLLPAILSKRLRLRRLGGKEIQHISTVQMYQLKGQLSHYGPDLFRATVHTVQCPEVMAAELTCPVEITLRNDSTAIWQVPGLGTPAISVSYQWIRPTGEVYEQNGLRTGLPRTLRPGEAAKLIAQVLPPAEPGDYVLRWNLVVEPSSPSPSAARLGSDVAVRVSPARTDNAVEFAEGKYWLLAERIPGWYRGEEAKALARVCYELPDGAIIVAIGVFLGSSTVLMAGARKLRGSGKVHCVDPFDASGDAHSVPVYREIIESLGGGLLRSHFDENIRRAGLTKWVEVHQGRASEVAEQWATPVDMLMLAGDQSPRGAREAYESWRRFLKPGGIIALGNTGPGSYADDTDGNWRIVQKDIKPPEYADIQRIARTTFARRISSQC